MLDSYQPSGRVGKSTLVWTLTGLLIAVGLAWLYQRLLDWIPLIYINFLLTLGSGFALGVITAMIVGLGHCRNVVVALVLR